MPPPRSKPGAPLGNKNRLKHGHHVREAVRLRAEVRAFVRAAKAAKAFAAQNLTAKKVD